MERRRVLIVEADPTMLNMLEEALEDRGCDCLAADNVPSALDLTNTFEPDLILLDLNLPRIDGTAFLKLARQYLPVDVDIPPIIVISGHEEKEILEYVQQLGAADILVKPVDANRLLSLIDHYVTN